MEAISRSVVSRLLLSVAMTPKPVTKAPLLEAERPFATVTPYQLCADRER